MNSTSLTGCYKVIGSAALSTRDGIVLVLVVLLPLAVALLAAELQHHRDRRRALARRYRDALTAPSADEAVRRLRR